MIPYGKNKKLRYNHPDNHPQKGWVNWWEVEIGDVDKNRERQTSKINLKKEVEMINDNYVKINIKNKKRKREIRWRKRLKRL